MGKQGKHVPPILVCTLVGVELVGRCAWWRGDLNYVVVRESVDARKSHQIIKKLRNEDMRSGIGCAVLACCVCDLDVCCELSHVDS